MVAVSVAPAKSTNLRRISHLNVLFSLKSELPFFNTTTTTPQCRKRLSIHNAAQTANKGVQFCTSRNLPLF